MDRVYSSNVSNVLMPKPVSLEIGYANDSLGVATTPGLFWYQLITEEIRNVIIGAGILPDGSNLNQLTLAISDIVNITLGPVIKLPVRVIDVVGVTKSGIQTVDGIALVDGDRVLRNVSNNSDNGVWVVSSTGAWNRPIDYYSGSTLLEGSTYEVSEGNNANTIWVLNKVIGEDIIVDTTNCSFTNVTAALTSALNAISTNLNTNLNTLINAVNAFETSANATYALETTYTNLSITENSENTTLVNNYNTLNTAISNFETSLNSYLTTSQLNTYSNSLNTTLATISNLNSLSTTNTNNYNTNNNGINTLTSNINTLTNTVNNNYISATTAKNQFALLTNYNALVNSLTSNYNTTNSNYNTLNNNYTALQTTMNTTYLSQSTFNQFKSSISSGTYALDSDLTSFYTNVENNYATPAYVLQQETIVTNVGQSNFPGTNDILVTPQIQGNGSTNFLVGVDIAQLTSEVFQTITAHQWNNMMLNNFGHTPQLLAPTWANTYIYDTLGNVQGAGLSFYMYPSDGTWAIIGNEGNIYLSGSPITGSFSKTEPSDSYVYRITNVAGDSIESDTGFVLSTPNSPTSWAPLPADGLICSSSAGGGGGGSSNSNTSTNKAIFTVQLALASDTSIFISGTITLEASNSFYSCVAVESYLSNYQIASSVKVNDLIELSDQITLEDSLGVVTYSETTKANGYRFVTTSGASLRCSDSAPIPTKDNGLTTPKYLLDKEVPVLRKGIKTWEKVIEVTDIGLIDVQFISVNDKCFWAGETKDAFILHHNKSIV